MLILERPECVLDLLELGVDAGQLGGVLLPDLPALGLGGLDTLLEPGQHPRIRGAFLCDNG